MFSGFVDHGFSGFLRWKGAVNAVPVLPPTEVAAALPVTRPDPAALAAPPAQGSMQVTWLGHACVLAQFNGWTVLADPIFSRRCAPVQVSTENEGPPRAPSSCSSSLRGSPRAAACHALPCATGSGRGRSA